MNVIVVKF